MKLASNIGLLWALRKTWVQKIRRRFLVLDPCGMESCCTGNICSSTIFEAPFSRSVRMKMYARYAHEMAMMYGMNHQEATDLLRFLSKKVATDDKPDLVELLSKHHGVEV